jgi:hypothetical protein
MYHNTIRKCTEKYISRQNCLQNIKDTQDETKTRWRTFKIQQTYKHRAYFKYPRLDATFHSFRRNSVQSDFLEFTQYSRHEHSRTCVNATIHPPLWNSEIAHTVDTCFADTSDQRRHQHFWSNQCMNHQNEMEEQSCTRLWRHVRRC